MKSGIKMNLIHGTIWLATLGFIPLLNTGETIGTVVTPGRMLVNNLATPRLRGIQVNGRLAGFYRPDDLSVGLVGQSVEGIYGYDPATATKIVEKIVLLAAKPAAPVAKEKKEAPPKPETQKKPAAAAKK